MSKPMLRENPNPIFSIVIWGLLKNNLCAYLGEADDRG
jgi:hypothetical protein